MTPEEEQTLIEEYLKYLDHERLPMDPPTTKEELERLLDEMSALAATNPYSEAWVTLHDLVYTDPEAAWRVTLGILGRTVEEDHNQLGAGPLEQLIWRHPAVFVDRFEAEILGDMRFRDAFTYVRMGGVPLTVQRRLNAALVHTGVDPRSLIEFDETIPDDFEG
jgi:hypothetical protein